MMMKNEKSSGLKNSEKLSMLFLGAVGGLVVGGKLATIAVAGASIASLPVYTGLVACTLASAYIIACATVGACMGYSYAKETIAKTEQMISDFRKKEAVYQPRPYTPA